MPVLRMEDGAALTYADEGAGPAVLLVHGWAAHGGFFSDLSAKLARTHRVVTPTLRGHLGSECGTAPLTVETLGRDILTLVEKLDLTSLRALGWSMGAMALWSAAPKLKQRLRGLVIEEMGPKIVNDDDWSFGLCGDYAAHQVASTLTEINADWPAYVARLAPRMFSAEARTRSPELIAWTATEMAKADPRAMAEYWRSMAAQDFRAALGAIAAPVLAVHGAESQIYPEGATEFVARSAPRGASFILDGAGHVPHLEAPDAFFELVSDFLLRTNQDVLKEGVLP